MKLLHSLFFLWAATSAVAAPVQGELRGRILNASLVETGLAREEAVLIIHGTWAHQDMEIVRNLQAALAERGLPSLAPTLSLGVSDRTGFLPCSARMQPDERTVDPEIAWWLDWLKARGYRTVTLLGHSRGASQSARFIRDQRRPDVSRLVLLAPMTWRFEEERQRYDSGSARKLEDLLAAARSHPDRFIGPLRLLKCVDVSTRGATFLAYYEPGQVRHVPDMLADIRIRTDVVVATGDDVSRWQAGDLRMADERLNVRAHVIEGADHFFRDLYLDDALDAVLQPATDFSRADPGMVQVVFVALSDCPVCLRMEREALYPLLRSGAIAGKARVTQILLDDPRPMVGFDGETTTTNAFADFYSSRMTPSLLFLDANGIPLQPAITGYNTPELYGARIERAVALASEAIKDGSPSAPPANR